MKKLASPHFYFHYLRRSDGVVQRYRTKSKFLGKGYRQLPRTRALQRRFGKRVRAYEKIEKPKRRMWRFTVGLSFYVTHKYYSVTLTTWAQNKKDVDVAGLKEQILKVVEKRVKYTRGEWWFPGVPNIGWDEVNYDDKLVGKVEVFEAKHS